MVMEELDAIFGPDEEDDVSVSQVTESTTEKAASSSHSTAAKVKSRPASSGVLAFHNGTEEAMYRYVVAHSVRGDIADILRVVDDYCYTQHWMMHIGDLKQPFLRRALFLAEAQKATHPDGKGVQKAREAALTVVELGSYCGYSALFLASMLNTERGDSLYCVECDPHCVKWTKRMIEYAGVGDYVKVLPYAASECSRWRQHLPLNDHHHSPGTASMQNTPEQLQPQEMHHQPQLQIDLLLIDHEKAAYLPDLITIEQSGLLRSGSVVVADNVLSFGCPLEHYLSHVRASKEEGGLYSHSELHETLIEYADVRVAGKITAPVGDRCGGTIDTNSAQLCENIAGKNDCDAALLDGSIERQRQGQDQIREEAVQRSSVDNSLRDGIEISIFR